MMIFSMAWFFPPFCLGYAFSSECPGILSFNSQDTGPFIKLIPFLLCPGAHQGVSDD